MTRTRDHARAVERSMSSALEPPASMPVEVRPIWDEITSSVCATHFHVCDAAALANYCVALKILRGLERDVLEDPSDGAAFRRYSKTSTAVSMMAGKLRLTPSSRNPRRNDYGHDPAEKAKDEEGFLGGG